MNLWREEITQIEYESSLDSAKCAAMFHAPETDGLVPLLVGLHTWSNDCFNPSSSSAMADWSVAKGWAFVYPDFRGPNWTPPAMGSEFAVADIVDAVEFAKKNARIDENRIYLLGGSGGGYASLLMAGRAPDIWAGVSSWCPIVDLIKWHAECSASGYGYDKHIEQAAGGDPRTDSRAADECRKRSAITYLPAARGVSVDIATGIHDGHTGSVPASHAMEGFNILANPKDRLTKDEMEFIVQNESIPEHLIDSALSDVSFGENRPLFRRISGNVRLTIFEGGHDILHHPALHWLEAQRKGSAPVWDPAESTVIGNSTSEGVALGR